MIPKPIKAILNTVETKSLGRILLLPIRAGYELLMWNNRCFRSLLQLQKMIPSSCSRLEVAELKVAHIEVPSSEGLFSMNPVMFQDCSQGGWLSVFRVSSWQFSPLSNWRGHIRYKKTQDLSGENRWTSKNVFNRLIMHKLNDDTLDLVFETNHEANLEDPRHFCYEGENWLLCTNVIAGVQFEEEVVRHEIAAIRLRDLKIVKFDSPFNQITEKNWVPIGVREENLLALYSNNPLVILKLNLETGLTSIANSIESSFPSTHGGSSLVDIEEEFLIRISRIKLPMSNRGFVHFQLLSAHARSGEELAMSRPFVLSVLGLEVCNSLNYDKDNNEIVFSWGENDQILKQGRIKKESLLDWFWTNPLKQSNESKMSIWNLNKMLSRYPSGTKLI